MHTPEGGTPGGSTARRWRPWLLAGAALLLALGSWREHRERTQERHDALAALDPRIEAWLPEEIARDLRRERDPTWIRVRQARSRVAAAMDPTFVGDLRLERAAELAAQALAERPATWQAAMLLGAATYLARSAAQDPRLFTAYREWEAPLELALELAPGKPEPRRFLAVAYLELWPAVSEEKRRLGRNLIGEAFRDPTIFRRLAGIWLEVVTDRDEAFAAIPPDPAAWGFVGTLLARDGDWAGVFDAYERQHAAQEIHAQELLEDAQRRLRGGDSAGGRLLLLRTATLGDPGPTGAPHLVTALRLLPPGPAGHQASALRDWLLWSLDLCVYGRCPLPEATLDRLSVLADDLTPPETALAALASGRLADAERLERRSDRLWHPSWSPYLLAKARELARRGEPEGAAAALDQVHPSWTDRPLYRWTRREVLGPDGSGEPEDPESALWPADVWRPATARGEIAARRTGADARERLELWLEDQVSALQLELPAVPGDGAVVEIRLDGAVVARRAVVAAGDLTLDLASPAAPGLHLLEVETLAGERVLPGELKALPGGAPGGAQRSAGGR